MRVSTFLGVLVSIPKTIFFNLKCFPLKQAVRLPVYIHYNVKLGELHKNMIKITVPLTPFMVRYGIDGVKGISTNKSQIWLQNGTITFKGKVLFAEGVSIRNNGNLVFGGNVSIGKNCFISCSDEIVFGTDILFAWNGTIRDSDGHALYMNGTEKPSHKPISIGNHVWIASEVKILKGVTIPDGCVVALGSIVTRPFDEQNILIGGYPAKKLQEDIVWHR